MPSIPKVDYNLQMFKQTVCGMFFDMLKVCLIVARYQRQGGVGLSDRVGLSNQKGGKESCSTGTSFLSLCSVSWESLEVCPVRGRLTGATSPRRIPTRRTRSRKMATSTTPRRRITPTARTRTMVRHTATLRFLRIRVSDRTERTKPAELPARASRFLFPKATTGKSPSRGQSTAKSATRSTRMIPSCTATIPTWATAASTAGTSTCRAIPTKGSPFLPPVTGS